MCHKAELFPLFPLLIYAELPAVYKEQMMKGLAWKMWISKLCSPFFGGIQCY